MLLNGKPVQSIPFKGSYMVKPGEILNKTGSGIKYRHNISEKFVKRNFKKKKLISRATDQAGETTIKQNGLQVLAEQGR